MSIEEPIEHVWYINERQKWIFSAIKELKNLWDSRFIKELELTISISNDSWLIEKTKIPKCTDKLLLESIKYQVITILEMNKKYYKKTWLEQLS